jgi:hypothetical protein
MTPERMIYSSMTEAEVRTKIIELMNDGRERTMNDFLVRIPLDRLVLHQALRSLRRKNAIVRHHDIDLPSYQLRGAAA